jgi:hypothetical protein
MPTRPLPRPRPRPRPLPRPHPRPHATIQDMTLERGFP